jgi:hypothetical protein
VKTRPADSNDVKGIGGEYRAQAFAGPDGISEHMSTTTISVFELAILESEAGKTYKFKFDRMSWIFPQIIAAYRLCMSITMWLSFC